MDQFDEPRPSSTHAEMTILGGCLVDAVALNDAAEFLEPDDFHLDSHRKIYSHILELFEAGIPADIVTVSESLRTKHELDSVGGVSYLASLSEGIPRKLSIDSYIRIVRDKSIRRKLMVTCETGSILAADATETGMAVLQRMEEMLLDLGQAYTHQAFGTILDEVKGAGGIDAFVGKMCDPMEMTGLPSGYIELDAMTGGFQESELTIIAARPSQGKSTFMLNLATNIVLADAERVVPIFSLEMSKSSLYRRMLASLAHVNSKRAQAGHISQEERRRISGALLAIAEKNIVIDDSSNMTTTQMRAKARRLKQKHGRLDLILIDYLQLMTGKKSQNREQEVSSISRGLKAMAKELNVPVVALAQVGRSSEKRAGSDNRPRLSDLRESGAIEQDADVVQFIHREEYYRKDDEDVKGLAEIIVAKNREGPTGTVNLAFLSDVTRFENLQRGQ